MSEYPACGNRRKNPDDHDLMVEMHGLLRTVTEKVNKHDETIYGNGKPGLTSLNTIPQTIRDHARSDAALFTVMVTIQLAIFGKVLNLY